MAGSVFESAKSQMGKALKFVKISDNALNILNFPKRVLEVNFPVRMDNGKLNIFKGYRALYNDAKGPGKGGIRFHQNVSLDEIVTLAFWMAMKTSVVNLPFGGAKGGVIVDPKTLSRDELKRLSEGYIKSIFEFVGEDKDIPAPDVNTNEEVMGWMLKEYERIAKKKSPEMITGKPVRMGGSLGRTAATGKGVFYVIEEIARIKKFDRKNTKVAIVGFGNVGYNLAVDLHDAGYKVVAVSDSKGGIYTKEGVNPKDVMKIKEKTGSVTGYSKGKTKKISKEGLLSLDVDILVPAALEGVITKENAEGVKAKIIVEAANGPITSDADNILERKGVEVVPDILANAGGVTASYFEWVQNKRKEKWSEKKVFEELKKIMVGEFNQIREVMLQKKVSYRTAAYIVALERLSKAIENKIKD